MTAIDRKLLIEAVASPRWAALVRADLDPVAVGTWDPRLLRESRVLVPIDVQALYVPGDATEVMVALPFGLTEPDGQPAAPMPVPFDPGVPRAPGVHLHWAMPDALLRGTLRRRPDEATNRLDLPPLPDRWLVLRLFVPHGATQVAVRGWVVCADIGTVVPLASWSGEQSVPAAARHTVAPAELTGSIGGSVQWASSYDAVIDRFAFHDSLDDLAVADPPGVTGDQVGYLVAGWWSRAGLDPLDAARTDVSLYDLLDRFGWHRASDLENTHQGTAGRVDAVRRGTLGLATAERYGSTVAPQQPAAPTDPGSLISRAVKPGTSYVPQLSPFAEVAGSVVSTEPEYPRSTLLHGCVHGVPVSGPVEAALENRPAPTDLGVVLGHHGDDIVASTATDGFGVTDPAARRATERLVGGFAGHILDRLSTPDGVVDIEEREHGLSFAGQPGGTSGTDRLRMGDPSAPLIPSRAGHGVPTKTLVDGISRPRIKFLGRNRYDLRVDDYAALRATVLGWGDDAGVQQPATEVREISRPAPRFFVPTPPVVAVRGARRSLRHRGDGRFSPDGVLRVRWPSEVLRAPGLVDLARVLPTLANGAIPEELQALAREAILTNPYLTRWLADTAAEAHGLDRRAAQSRFAAESVLRYGRDATYDGGSTFMSRVSGAQTLTSMLVADQVRRHSLYEGVEPDPVGVTAWSQPWVPLWLEWEAELTETDPLDAWSLGPIDLEPPPATTPGRRLTHRGRSVLTTGVATTMAEAIKGWLVAEDARDAHDAGEADEAAEAALARLRDCLDQLDVVSAVLDGLREQLLGLPYLDGRVPRPEPGLDPPELLARGELRLSRARLVDAFGQVLDLPDATTPGLPARDEIAGGPALDGGAGALPALRIRPRLNVPARWLFRLVDPAGSATDAAEGRIDQVDPTLSVNPVAGFLLPDHIDDALEVFDVAGTPLGQLMHEAFGGGVVWDPAPGRPVPADAGPLEGLAPAQRIVGQLAAGLVAADAIGRQGLPARPETESALSALLRAIDTTLWTVDTYAGLGSEHIVGLVGRPIAVVRARLSLEIKADLDEVDLSDPARRAVREQAYRDLAALAFPVRLGELTRTDDGLLGFFVDDDYSTFHVVDKVVASHAFDSGRGRGQLGSYGSTPQVPGQRAIEHPYVLAEDELRVHPGQVLTLTLLMHPAGKVHLTSGVLPRKSLRLYRDWVAPGLAVMAPSARVGPVLVDPDKVSLPLISAFPREQLFTRRNSPLTWQDDPILAATQTALLPDLAHEVQEGYIRIAPATPGSGQSGAGQSGAGQS